MHSRTAAQPQAFKTKTLGLILQVPRNNDRRDDESPLEATKYVTEKNKAESAASLPPLMSNLNTEKKTDEAPERPQEEGEQDWSQHADSLLGFLHEPTVDLVNETCDTEEERHMAMKTICEYYATLQSDAPCDREEFEASIPENPQDWTERMWDYMYQKEQEDKRKFAEQEDKRKFAEQQLAMQKHKEKRVDRRLRVRRKIAQKTSK